MEAARKKVYVGLSGGVDSSVSAALLKEEGYDVTGVFIRVWQPDFMGCSQTEDRVDAMRVAAKLRIPFVTMDFTELYKKEVIDTMIAGYARGETPNPDIFCNRAIKFGAFFDEAMRQGADYVATGHYARIRERNGRYELLTGNDSSKDQSYFLYTLTEGHLAKTLFPVGALEKKRVREIAAQFGLPTATKKDSQGLCFVGTIDIKEFLTHYLGEKEGEVRDVEGNVIGSHPGAHLFTLGERHGFSRSENTPVREPLYVVAKNTKKNVLTVAPNIEAVARGEVYLNALNWIGEAPKKGDIIMGRVRYRQSLLRFKVVGVTAKSLTLSPQERGVVFPEGQSLVIYDGEVCRGGGILS